MSEGVGPNPFDQLRLRVSPLERRLAEVAISASKIVDEIPLAERGTKRVFLSLRDLTREDKLAGVSVLVASVIHEFRYTPMADIYMVPEVADRVLTQLNLPHRVLTSEEYFAEFMKNRGEK